MIEYFEWKMSKTNGTHNSAKKAWEAVEKYKLKNFTLAV